ncbi:unnamed protein product [Victoria cruziana]
MDDLRAGPSASWVPKEMSVERRVSDISLCDSDDDCCGENDPKENGDDGFVPSPLVPLKEHLERDKEDESLRKWKEKLLGHIDDSENGRIEPEVTFLSIGIVSDSCPEFSTSLPIERNHRNVLFHLKEGSNYRLKLTFRVKYNIVSGLTYSNTVWKGGLQVDQSKGMLGTFAPQQEPYIHMLEEEMTPSGVMARGIYMAKLKFEDDDRRCHFELDYAFEIKKRC